MGWIDFGFLVLKVFMFGLLVYLTIAFLRYKFPNPFEEEKKVEIQPTPPPVQYVPAHPVLPHLLLWGPPGTGKTALARVVANELGGVYGYNPSFVEVPALTFREDWALDNLIIGLRYGMVVFIDEVHGLPIVVEEALYSIMQDWIFNSNRYGKLLLPKFTLIGATTRAGALEKPFRDRFTIEIELEPTTKKNLVQILRDQENRIPVPTSFKEYHGQHRAKKLLKAHLVALTRGEEIEVNDEIKNLLAQRALGNPRVLKQLYTHVVAYGKWKKDLSIYEAEECLSLLGIDEYGLHPSDQRVIKALLDRGNKPMGLNSLAGMANVSKADLENVIEPRLVYCEFIDRTPRGRVLSPKALNLFQKTNI